MKTYLIDGYNLLWKLKPGLMGEKRLEEARDALEKRLIELLAVSEGLEIMLVYDGAGRGGKPTASSPGLKIVFSPSGVSADEKILDYVEGGRLGGEVYVVSSDRKDITRRLGGTGARPISSEKFIGSLAGQLPSARGEKSSALKKSEKPPAPDPEEVDGWLEEFGMKDDGNS